MTFRLPIILMTVAVAVLRCAEPSRVEPAEAGCSSGAYLADTEGSYRPTAVTFYGDLWPVLSSTRSGQAYKCTTCHAHYAKPSGMNSVEEVGRVIESMRSGRMPRGGDAVPAEKIELFTMWRIQGFQAGKYQTKPTSNQADANPSSTNCP